MFSVRFISKRLRESFANALCLSGLCHFGVLVLLAQTWHVAKVEVPRLAGSEQVAIQLEASFRPVTSVTPVILPAATMEVTPSLARALDRTFLDTSSTDIDWLGEMSVPVREPLPTEVMESKVTRAHAADTVANIQAMEMLQPLDLPRTPPRLEPPVKPIRVPPAIGTITPPTYDYLPPPRYPELARQRGWQGTVLLVVGIDATGRVTRVEVEESSGYQLLDAAAVGAVRRWRYRPALGPAGPVATEELQPVTFRLPR